MVQVESNDLVDILKPNAVVVLRDLLGRFTFDESVDDRVQGDARAGDADDSRFIGGEWDRLWLDAMGMRKLYFAIQLFANE